MKINISANSKELATLVKNDGDIIKYEFDIDIYTESKKEITTKEETAILASIFWALCTLLPHTIISNVFKKWNSIVKELQKGLSKKAAKVSSRIVTKEEE